MSLSIANVRNIVYDAHDYAFLFGWRFVGVRMTGEQNQTKTKPKRLVKGTLNSDSPVGFGWDTLTLSNRMVAGSACTQVKPCRTGDGKLEVLNIMQKCISTAA